MIFALPAYSIEFYQCIDSKGQSHYTNLPKNSLDKECRQKDNQYLVMLNQDYQNLENEFLKYETPVEDINLIEMSVDTVTKPISDLLDSDKALDELLENTQEKRKNFATEFFRARTEAVKSILEEENPNPPDS